MSGPRRLIDYDYANPGSYFVTICVHNMEHRLGEIRGATMHPNDAGVMIAETWESNADRYSGIEIDVFIVMPNHLHGIVHLGTDPRGTDSPSSLTTVVGTFKSLAATAYADGVRRGQFPPFDRSLWQRSFYDRIIRDQYDLDAVRNYIEANPARWWARRSGLGA